MTTCSRKGCDEPAVVAVVFPKLRAATYGCEAHRELTRQTLREGREKANKTLATLGYPPLREDEGPKWVEL